MQVCFLGLQTFSTLWQSVDFVNILHRPHSIAVGAMVVFPPAFVRERFCLGNNYKNVLLSGFLLDSPCIYGKIRLYCICIYVCVEVEYVGT